LTAAARARSKRDVAVYTDISEAELAALLAEYELGEPRALVGVQEGVENSNFRLETEGGRWFLTVFERRVREADLPFFLGLMRHLSGRGFPCPAPIPDRRGRLLSRVHGKPAAIVTLMPGSAARRPSSRQCRAAGEGLARLHLAGEDFPLRRTNDLGQPMWAAQFAPLRAEAERLKPGLAAEIDEDLSALALSWPRNLPTGTIHADFFPDNVFFQGDRFSAAIDFYFACTDAFAYDLAVCLNAWCFESDGGFNLTHARAFVAGYEARRPLSPAERDALPLLARGAAMRFFLTRLHDWGSTPEGALVRPKDPREYAARLAFHREAMGLALFGEDA
jgi:homoserine kinase type II